MSHRSSACLLVLAIAGAELQGGGKQPPQPKPPAAPRASAFETPPVEQDAPLVGRINTAIARGESWLVGAQGRRGSWQGEEGAARVGYSELALYALASGGDVAPEDGKGSDVPKALERGFEFVRRSPFEQTYALSLLLLALDARAQPRWERTSLPRMTAAERARYGYPRKLTTLESLWIQTTVDALIEHRYKGLWSYEKHPGTGDISNAQFALLGLRAASNCGVSVKPEVWLETIDYFLEYQDGDGPPAKFDVPRFGGGKIAEIVSIEAHQRSWGYSFSKGGAGPSGRTTPNASPQPAPRRRPQVRFTFGASGTHSAIGIASLQIARDEIQRSLRRTPSSKVQDAIEPRNPVIDLAIRDGLGWLAAHWTLEDDPGGGFPFYYLYSIERVGALLSDRFVAGHDWYREGAEILMRRQRPDGAWPDDMGEVNAIGAADVVNTAFALLFLRRATMPGVVTPQLR